MIKFQDKYDTRSKIYNNSIINEMNTEVKKYKTVLSTAFSYVPSVINEKEGKFAEVLQKSISLIG